MKEVGNSIAGLPDPELPDPDTGGRPFLSLPNPFSRAGKIAFRLEGAEPAPVTLQAFDVRGRLVRTFLRKQPLVPGEHAVEWDGADGYGHPLPYGMYFLRLTTPAGTEEVKVVLLR